jgi:hypothetical protein
MGSISPCPLTRTRSSWRCWPSIPPDGGAAAQRVCRPEAGRVGGAKRRQFRCRAVGVRHPELVAELEAIGGDVVVVDTPDVPERIKAAVGRIGLPL